MVGAKEGGVIPFPKTLRDLLTWGGWKKDYEGEYSLWHKRNNTYNMEDLLLQMFSSTDRPGMVCWHRQSTDERHYDPDDPELLDLIVKSKDGWTL